VRRRVTGSPASATLELALARRASVEVRGDVRAIAGAGLAARAGDGEPLVLDALAPGRLDLALERGAGPPLVLELELAPGERRVLTVR
jgi:hypothetical protein